MIFSLSARPLSQASQPGLSFSKPDLSACKLGLPASQSDRLWTKGRKISAFYMTLSAMIKLSIRQEKIIARN